MATPLNSNRGNEMIDDRFNPKFSTLSPIAQTLWTTFQFIQDYETHQFSYSLDKLMKITGRYRESINNAKNELEIKKIISVIRSHRKTNQYTLLEAWTIQKGKTFNYFLSSKIELSNVVNSNSTDTSKRTPSNPILSNPYLSIKSSSKVQLTVRTVQVDIAKKDDDFLNLSEAEKKALARIETYMDAKCAIKWNSGLHSTKFPNCSIRAEIARLCYNMVPFVKNTIDGKIKEVDNEDRFDEFVLKSIRHSLKEGKDYYG